MLLEPLISVIETVKKRMQQHQLALRRSEALTRYALIDPVLRVLGWDTEDPEIVVPEYGAGGGFADYALMGSSGPVSLLEAKKLGEDLTSKIGQALNYCNEQGINHMLLSDGDTWVMYEVFRQAPIEERRLVSLSIQNNPAYEAALKLLLLWRPNLESGRPVAVNEPVLEIPIYQAQAASHYPEPVPVSPVGTGNWISLASVEVGKGKKHPREVRFSAGEGRTIESWGQVLVAAADWLVKAQYLTAAGCPISGLGFINNSPAGPSTQSTVKSEG